MSCRPIYLILLLIALSYASCTLLHVRLAQSLTFSCNGEYTNSDVCGCSSWVSVTVWQLTSYLCQTGILRKLHQCCLAERSLDKGILISIDSFRVFYLMCLRRLITTYSTAVLSFRFIQDFFYKFSCWNSILIWHWFVNLLTISGDCILYADVTHNHNCDYRQLCHNYFTLDLLLSSCERIASDWVDG